MKWEETLLIAFFPLAIMIVSAHALVFWPGVYEHFQTKEEVDLSHGVALTHSLLSYFTTSKYTLPDAELSNREAEHILDVKILLHLLLAASALYLLVFLFSIDHINMTKVLLYGSSITLGLLALSTLIPFTTLFVFFHELFFTPGSWTFASDSALIRAYPFGFFLRFASAIAGLAAGLCSTLFAVTLYRTFMSKPLD
ncbi:DUF1461 domain-containing protein [Candidatus Woesearchaeota archaeon]|nr:DUF1461 domain-containing protein [Candidatus Woesearchaeota archaeon]